MPSDKPSALDRLADAYAKVFVKYYGGDIEEERKFFHDVFSKMFKVLIHEAMKQAVKIAFDEVAKGVINGEGKGPRPEPRPLLETWGH